jgi:hypothetical protein
MKGVIRKFDENISLKASKSVLLLEIEKIKDSFIPLEDWQKIL